MDRLLTAFIVAGIAVAVTTTAQAAGDAGKGQALFARCQVCHTAQKGAPNRIGPNLFGVVGRKAGTLPSYSYSNAMKKFGAVWDQPLLSKYLMSPSQVVPGTKMTFAGFSSQQQADDMAAYLATLK